MNRTFRLVFSILLLWQACASAQAQEPDRLIALKAAYIFNIAKFIYWADSNSQESDLMLCLPPSAAHYRPAFRKLESKRKGNTTFRLRMLDSRGTLDDCDILYLAGLEDLDDDRFAADRPGLLTVADENLKGEGSIIEFAVIDNRLRFSVNLKAADQVGLKVSSKLLTLAHEVQRGSTARRRASL